MAPALKNVKFGVRLVSYLSVGYLYMGVRIDRCLLSGYQVSPMFLGGVFSSAGAISMPVGVGSDS